MRNKANASEDNNDKGPKAETPKVPTIRLKLKITKENNETGAIVKEPTSETNKPSTLSDVNEGGSEGNKSVNALSPVSQVSAHSQTDSVSSSTSSSSTTRFCGTFKYRPFKLFPLLPPLSRYRVLVTPPHTTTSLNPAIRLNYLWTSSRKHNVYTDDSDLVCIAVRDGWCGSEEIRGKELMIEVEVVDENEYTENSEYAKDTQDSRDTKDIRHIASNTTTLPIITPRTYPAPHDGYHIRILSVTLNPSAVHLKRWRKLKRRSDGQPPKAEPSLLTPKFKTGNGIV